MLRLWFQPAVRKLDLLAYIHVSSLMEVKILPFLKYITTMQRLHAVASVV